MRKAEITRRTNETDISLELSLDGGSVSVATGIGFFDHMLNAFALHGGFGLDVKAVGDLFVDCHHTVEDVGIVLGQAFRDALGERKGIRRFASGFVPMDEALAFAAADVSGRGFLVFNAEFPQDRVGSFDVCVTGEFFRAFATNAGITLHLHTEYGTNSHHIVEALFKATARVLKEAVEQTDGSVPSTKGVL